MMVTMRNLRAKLHEELKHTYAAWDRHNKEWNCKTDSGGCLDWARFQERVATLNHVIRLTGGRAPDAVTDDRSCIDELR